MLLFLKKITDLVKLAINNYRKKMIKSSFQYPCLCFSGLVSKLDAIMTKHRKKLKKNVCFYRS